MNELQKKLLDELVAVSISNEEDFDKVINFLSINNNFLSTGEPVIKLTYPGPKEMVIYKQDNIIYWQLASQFVDERYQLVNTYEFFKSNEQIIEVKAKVIEEEININEKTMSLTVQKRPANEAIVSNIDDIVKAIPYIEAKKNVVVDENNYKDFVKKQTGLVPLYRKYAKDLDNEKKEVKQAYIAPYNEFEQKIKKVINALNSTAQTVADNVEVFEQKKKNELRKTRQAAIDGLANVLISKSMISKEYADQFAFDEKWLNVSCSEKKFKEQVEEQFQNLIEKEKNYKLNIEMIDKTIKNSCYIAHVDEKLISREKYQSLLATEGLAKITEMISDEVENIKQQSMNVAKQKDAELQKQKEEFEKKQKELEIKHQKELESAKKQTSVKQYQPIKRGDEIIANVNDKHIVTEIKETPENFKGKTWKKVYEFEGDLAALQMLNRYMDVIKNINPTFNFGEVKTK